MKWPSAGWEDKALASVEQDRRDAVVLDLYLDGKEAGWEILHELRDDPTTSRLPVILCSSAIGWRVDHEPLIRRYRAQVLNKPFDLHGHTAMLRDVMAL